MKVTLLATVVAVFGMAGSVAAQDIVEEAKKDLVIYAGPQTDWRGPTSSPKPEAGKKIAYISNDENNDASRAWGVAIQEAGSKIGWDVTIIDGKATPVGWINAFNQAIALGVDGIVTSADAASLQEPIGEAVAKNIPIVGIHAAALPGPNEELHLFTNIQQDPREIGKAQADWVIVDSGGKGKVVVTSHNEFAIAEAKSRATEARIKECPDCEVVEYVSSPIAEVAQRQPQLVISWIQKYGTPLYVTAVADYTLDFQVPALRSAGVEAGDIKLVGADGQRSAYERIRSGEYQAVTVSEPVEMQAYQAVDEINRAIQGEAPSDFVQAPYLVTPDNVDAEGGDQNAFVPTNDYKAKYLELWGVEG
ncbi:ABC transporter substrate-binding protein [Bauldia litoralis]|uniref:Ribose transport system substrate-binding protein n=1 Tax=Bauldia litoralis TaxID=665467 RepID=A0A1G6EB67_9HYPH|nr:substrate-binding domain-containing protein [Bauldia litoralis]SDB54651.1 ribose transport system substrate-binding protein [Bauldia litoralis]